MPKCNTCDLTRNTSPKLKLQNTLLFQIISGSKCNQGRIKFTYIFIKHKLLNLHNSNPIKIGINKRNEKHHMLTNRNLRGKRTRIFRDYTKWIIHNVLKIATYTYNC
jgi:hypothetical protein